MKNHPAMPPIKFDMYNITSMRVTKSNMTARLGEVLKATVHKAQVVEEPRAAHYRNDDRHDLIGLMHFCIK